MLGPVSRFPLGLIDLFGVKQNGEYPRSISQEMQPTLEVLKLTCQANGTDYRDLPVSHGAVGGTSVAGYYGFGATKLTAKQNECLLVTSWSILGVVSAVGSALPDCNAAIVNLTGTSGFYHLSDSTPRDTIAGAAQTKQYSKGGSGLWYVPPGFGLCMMINDSAIAAIGGLVQYEFTARYMRLRV